MSRIEQQQIRRVIRNGVLNNSLADVARNHLPENIKKIIRRGLYGKEKFPLPNPVDVNVCGIEAVFG